MANKPPKTISAYIAASPAVSKAHLTWLYTILKTVAPDAEETIKWGIPFFVEPRFLFVFSAHKAHAGFTSSLDALAPYRERLKDFDITKMGILKLPYNKPLPEDLIRKIARTRLKLVSERQDDSFW